MSEDPLLAALIGLRDRLDAVADEFREEIGELRIGLRDQLEGVAEEFREEIGGLRVEMRAEIGGLRAEMSVRFDRLEDKMTRLRDELDVAMGRIDEVEAARESSSATHRQLWRLYRRLQTDVDELKDQKGGPPTGA